MLSRFSRVQLLTTLWTVAHQAPLSWNSPGKNMGVGCHALLQGIFATQGSNPGLPHCRCHHGNISTHWDAELGLEQEVSPCPKQGRSHSKTDGPISSLIHPSSYRAPTVCEMLENQQRKAGKVHTFSLTHKIHNHTAAATAAKPL